MRSIAIALLLFSATLFAQKETNYETVFEKEMEIKRQRISKPLPTILF